jgi:DME family drug/metabolite transporter
VTDARRVRAVVAVAVASALWGTIGLAATIMPVDVPAVAVGAAGMGFGGVLLFLVAPRRAAAAVADPRARWWLILGAIGVITYPLAVYPAMRLTGVAIANVVALGSGPVFAAIIEWIIERRRPSLVWAIATGIAVLGIGLLVSGGGTAGEGQVLPGVLLALLGGLGYAVYATASARAIRVGHAPVPAMGAMFGLAAIVLVPIAVISGAPLATSAVAIGLVAYLAVGPLAVAYALFGVGVRTLSASTATTVSLLEPAVATLLAVLLLGERLAWLAWVGFALLIVAVVVVGAFDRRSART